MLVADNSLKVDEGIPFLDVLVYMNLTCEVFHMNQLMLGASNFLLEVLSTPYLNVLFYAWLHMNLIILVVDSFLMVASCIPFLDA